MCQPAENVQSQLPFCLPSTQGSGPSFPSGQRHEPRKRTDPSEKMTANFSFAFLQQQKSESVIFDSNFSYLVTL